MEIVPIFASEESPKGLYACRYAYEQPGKNELVKFFKLWGNSNHINKVIRSNSKNLSSWPRYPQTKEEASRQLITERNELYNKLSGSDLFQSGFEDKLTQYLKRLNSLFKPLSYNKPDKQYKAKAREITNDALLRIYALQLSSDLFLITGSGFKAVRATQQDSVLQGEIDRITEVSKLLETNHISLNQFNNTPFLIQHPTFAL